MTHIIESLLADSQPDLPRLRLALGKALKDGLDPKKASQLVLAHALASLGRALCLANSSEDGIELLAEAMETHSSAGSHVFLDLLINQAEHSGAQGEWREAIHRWQDIAVLMGERTPDFVYRELSHTYAQNRHGFGGSPDENYCWGDCH